MSDLVGVRDDLRQNTIYWGTAELTEGVVWKRIGRQNSLVTVEAGEACEAAVTAASTADPDGDDRFSRVDADSAGFPQRFLAHTIRLLEGADKPVVGEDFGLVLKNVTSLMARIEMKGYDKFGILGLDSEGIKVRHIVFERKDLDDDDLDDFKLRDWPVRSQAALNALDEMDASYRVIRIPAYDVNGDIIPPARYAACISTLGRHYAAMQDIDSEVVIERWLATKTTHCPAGSHQHPRAAPLLFERAFTLLSPQHARNLDLWYSSASRGAGH
ncbi:hypothetical protein DFH09DRAFT_1373443 [Mycena vulgaris]|nr:hypothetical protein DFH09DRAFT_1373443 [Mycena vulgaris]